MLFWLGKVLKRSHFQASINADCKIFNTCGFCLPSPPSEASLLTNFFPMPQLQNSGLREWRNEREGSLKFLLKVEHGDDVFLSSCGSQQDGQILVVLHENGTYRDKKWRRSREWDTADRDRETVLFSSVFTQVLLKRRKRKKANLVVSHDVDKPSIRVTSTWLSPSLSLSLSLKDEDKEYFIVHINRSNIASAHEMVHWRDD